MNTGALPPLAPTTTASPLLLAAIDWNLVAMVLCAAATAVFVLAWAAQRRAGMRHLCTILGIMLIAFVAFREWCSVKGVPEASASTPVHLLVRRGATTTPTQLQVVVGMRTDPNGLSFDHVYEVIAPVAQNAASRNSDVTIAGVGLEARFTLIDSTTPGDIGFTATVSDLGSRMTLSGCTSASSATIDLGDKAPFLVVALTLQPVHRNVALLRGDRDSMTILVRTLFADDQLDELPSDDAVARLCAAYTDRSELAVVKPAADDSVRSLIHVVHPTGVLLLVLGVMLLGLTRIGAAPSLIVGIGVAVITVSGAARAGFSYHLRRFRSADGAVRIAAIVRVAHTTLFVNSASHALLEQFRRESDPYVRMIAVQAAVSGVPALVYSDDVATLVREASQDASQAVGKMAAKAERALAAARAIPAPENR